MKKKIKKWKLNKKAISTFYQSWNKKNGLLIIFLFNKQHLAIKILCLSKIFFLN